MSVEAEQVEGAAPAVERRRNYSVNAVSVAVLATPSRSVASPTIAPASHERTRTWTMVKGQMKYIYQDPDDAKSDAK